jgi:hypothetical protein
MTIRLITYLFFLVLTFNGVAQSFFGFSIDEKFSTHKNRIGASIFCQGKKKSKFGLSIYYDYSFYKYPSDISSINYTGTGYIPQRLESPPYSKDLGYNTTSTINGADIELFDSWRLATFRRSNLDLKISIGYSQLIDTYTTQYFGEKRIGKFAFNGLLCNMFTTYLIWYKNIGIEPLIGLGFYYPLLGKNYYLTSNPYVGIELEVGVSVYFQKNKKRQH